MLGQWQMHRDLVGSEECSRDAPQSREVNTWTGRTQALLAWLDAGRLLSRDLVEGHPGKSPVLGAESAPQ
jgi:hypothetical protein